MRYEWNISRTICLFKKLFSFLYIRCKDFFFLFTLRCSNGCFIHWHIILLFGCGGRIRTADLQVMSLMSYYFSTPRYLGGGDRDRTCDLLLAKQPLSQLSYTPKYLLNNCLSKPLKLSTSIKLFNVFLFSSIINLLCIPKTNVVLYISVGNNLK